jgi:hypothetical protein
VFLRHDMRLEVNASALAYLNNRLQHRVQYQVK